MLAVICSKSAAKAPLLVESLGRPAAIQTRLERRIMAGKYGNPAERYPLIGL
jgi:hypothetical protein